MVNILLEMPFCVQKEEGEGEGERERESTRQKALGNSLTEGFDYR
jgi:hypothetical protein